MTTCSLCGRQVKPDDTTAYKLVTGWERPGRGAGGQSGSSLVLRQALEHVAHATCVIAAQNGVHPEQTSLV